jgi:hypothetical protein
MTVRLGNVDYSDDSDDDESSSEEVSSDGTSEDENGSNAESDGEIDRDDSLLADETEEEDEEEEEEEEEDDGEVESNEDFLFDVDADDEVQSGLDQELAVGNEVDDVMMEAGWTRINNNDRTALGSMLLDIVQPRNLGRQQNLANGSFFVDAAETVRNILRGDAGLEGLSEIEDSLGIRIVRGDRGDGRLSAVGISSGLTHHAGPNILAGSGRPTVHQNNSAALTSSNRNLTEMR